MDWCARDEGMQPRRAPMHWQREIEQHILSEELLQRVFAHICKMQEASASMCPGGAPNQGGGVPSSRKSKARAVAAPCTRVSPRCADPVSDVTALMLSAPVQLVLGERGASFFRNHSRYLFPYRLMRPGQREALRRCLTHRNEWHTLNEHVVFAEGAQPFRLAPALCLRVMCASVFSARSVKDEEQECDHRAVCDAVLCNLRPVLFDPAAANRVVNEWLQSVAERDISARSLSVQHVLP